MRNATEFYAQQVSNFPCDKSLMCKNTSSVEFYCKENLQASNLMSLLFANDVKLSCKKKKSSLRVSFSFNGSMEEV